MDRMQEYTCRGHSQVLHAHTAMREAGRCTDLGWNDLVREHLLIHTCSERIHVATYV